MRTYIRIALFSFFMLWFASLWLWCWDLPNMVTWAFGEDPGLMLIPVLGIINIPVIIICSGYSFYRKYWYWFSAFMIIGGGPIIYYFSRVLFNAYFG
jgi:hypothetical protein